jgi:carboxyl-terminal processing protease
MTLKLNSRTFAVAAVLVASGTLAGNGMPGVDAAGTDRDRPPACQPPPPADGPTEPPQLKPTTITTIGQAYFCILDNYFSGPALDDRSLLVPAFAALTQELQRRGLDQPEATLPALTGKKNKWEDRDWAAFSQIYEQIAAKLPQDPAVQQAIAEATMQGMINSLNDNHLHWLRGFSPNLTGMLLSAFNGPGQLDPVAMEPLYVTQVGPGSPAETAGIRLGDEIVTINDVPPYVNGVLSEGVLEWLTQTTVGTPISITLHRPATDATFSVTVTTAPSPPPPSEVVARLVNGNIAYVKMPAFFQGASDQVFQAIGRLRQVSNLRGVILDLRGNTGGTGEERAKMLGALVHDTVTHYWCDVKDHCFAIRTDDSAPLLNLPVVALIDRMCNSACDSFGSAVKDLHLGTLVGTRTGGTVSGAPHAYMLDDGSTILLPKYHEIGANKEIVNTIGVAPDYYAPLTAADLSFGRDPGLAKAAELLR